MCTCLKHMKYVYLCLLVYTVLGFVYIYIQINLSIRNCPYAHMQININIYIYVYEHIYIMRKFMCIYIYVCVRRDIYIYIYIYSYVYIYIHVHIHVYIKLRIGILIYFYLFMPIAICQNCRRQWCWRIYIHISMYLFCIWMYLGFKHNMCLLGGIVSLFDFCFLLDASFSEQVFFHCKSRQQFWERKTKSRTSHRKIRKIESWKVKRLHCQFRKVEKSKSRKVEKWNGVIFNFEKSKSWKVKRLRFEFRKIEKSKRILFDFWLFEICRMSFQLNMRSSFFQLRKLL